MMAILVLLVTPIKAEESQMVVSITAYSLKECKRNKGLTASGKKVKKGIIAVSPDLEKKGLKMGTTINIKGKGTYIVADRTSKRLKKTIDIYMHSHKNAIKFGKKYAKISFDK